MKTLKNLLVLFLFSIVIPQGYAQPHPKSPLKILFVGYDPAAGLAPKDRDNEISSTSSCSPLLRDSVRMPAFKELLGKYFAEVKVEDYRKWKPEDSQPYDVTIFDYPTSVIEKTNGTGFASSRYLPDNFSKPTIFISGTAAIMGRILGLKLDWLCLCLDADAHHTNTRHPIFNGPLEKVKPTFEMEPTPEGIYHYPSGDTVPEKIPMWKVQKLSYRAGDPIGIGMVSRGSGFTDSPDAEVISSGVCEKSVTAVALGRHGNFFLWGFRGSPAEMTEEAKKVFVNTVAYMKQFDGKLPIARKYDETIMTTDGICELMQRTTKEWWQKDLISTKKINESIQALKKALADKVASGQKLTGKEAYVSLIRETSPPTWEEYLSRLMGPDWFKKFGTDVDAFHTYIQDNMGFVYCEKREFYIDEDVKKIGISNHDTKLLKKCVQLLKKGKDQDLALRILKKYTTENYDNTSEWKNWYNKNKSRLFFTEAGGWKFMVNTLKKSKK